MLMYIFAIIILSSALVSGKVGYSAYNPLAEGCCFDEDGTSEPFNHQTHACCDGTLIERPMEGGWTDLNYMCCGKELYNYQSHLCCGGETVPAEPGMECCVDQVYNIFKQTCCISWDVFDKNFQPTKYQILETEENSMKQCCGMELYDPMTSICCNNEIQTKSEHLLNVMGIACCGSQQYSYQTHLCCQKWGEVNGIQSAISETLHENQGYQKGCCGTEVFDFTTEVCCNQTIVPRPEEAEPNVWMGCCGAQPISDYTVQLCENGVLFEREHYNQDVCNGILYNTETDMCCGAEIVPISEEDDALGRNKCCIPPGNSFMAYHAG